VKRAAATNAPTACIPAYASLKGLAMSAAAPPVQPAKGTQAEVGRRDLLSLVAMAGAAVGVGAVA
jgi:hypothetical protein